MKVKVKNLGVLKQAEFSLGDFTIICGGNNTGKTYATYALYGFLNMWRQHISVIESARISEVFINNLLNDGVIRINLVEYAQNADTVLKELCELYTQNLPLIFAAPKERFRDSFFGVYLESGTLSEPVTSVSFERKIGTQNRQIFSISTAEGSAEVEISLMVNKQEVSLPPPLIRELLTDTINEIVFSQFFPDTFISSAERTGAAIFRKELNFARNRLLKEMSRAEDNLDPRELLFKSYQDYAMPVENNVEFTRQLESIAKKRSFLAAEHPQMLDWFSDIIGGAYAVTPNDDLYFVPKDERIKLSMDESSSGVRSMLDIGFYLRHAAEPGDLLMVDEPELNLHPENQRRIARLFARLVNLGIKVFITTHSDYIVKELNTLIMLNHDEPYLKRLAKQEGYEDSELIDAEKIKVYIAEKGLVQLDGNRRRSRCHTLVGTKVNPELGIEARSFDSTINKMNEIQEAILWGGDE